MTDLYMFSNNTKNETLGGSSDLELEEEKETIFGGGVSVSKWFQTTENVLNDSQTFSFLDHLAIPIGLHCFQPNEPSTYEEEDKDGEQDVIQDNIYDRLFYLSAKDVGSSSTKKRTTRKKNRKIM